MYSCMDGIVLDNQQILMIIIKWCFLEAKVYVYYD